MSDVRGLLAAAASRLGDQVDAEVLLLHALGKPRSWLFAHAEDELAWTSSGLCRAGGAPRRGRARGVYHRPARLLVAGAGGDASHPDPRPETELLVELALARLPEGGRCAVADLGTGSGAIALALAQERRARAWWPPTASAEALAVARRNAQRLAIGNVASCRATGWRRCRIAGLT